MAGIFTSSNGGGAHIKHVGISNPSSTSLPLVIKTTTQMSHFHHKISCDAYPGMGSVDKLDPAKLVV